MLEGAHGENLAGAPLPLRAIAKVLAAALTLVALAWALDLLRLMQITIHTEQFLALVLAVCFPLVFIAVPARRGGARNSLPWYDALLAVLSIAAMAYVTVRYPRISAEIAYQPLDALLVGAIIVPLLLEGLRRTVGMVFVIIVLVFVGFALLGQYIPGQLQGRPVRADELLVYLAIDPNGILGASLFIAASIVIAFIFMGQLLALSGGSRFFTDLSTELMGRSRGGSAKISIVASSLFGSISGSVVSNVASTGVVTIPLMRDDGYKPSEAGAIEATASTGGQLMPPIMGAAAFLMAEYLQVPYAEVALAALIPAILYYLALFIQVDLGAAKRGLRGAAGQRSNAVDVLIKGWIFPLPFAVLIVTLFWLNLRPEAAALYAAAALVPVGLVAGYRGIRMKPGDLLRALYATGFVVLDLVMIGAAAGLVIGILNISGLGFGMIVALVQVGQGSIALLLVLAAAVSIVLGMGMPTVGVYILLASLVAPALIEAGLNAMGAHLFILYFGMMSMITPPICVAAFAAATIAGAEPMRTGWVAMKLGWTAYIVPFLFVASPSLLMKGSALDIVLAFVTALGGVWLVSVAVVGYLTRPIGVLQRLGYVASGILLMIPFDAHRLAIWSDVIGLALGAALVVHEFLARRLPT